MSLQTKYQYTDFIYPYIINETKYQKYILRLLKYKNCKLKIFQKEKDLDIYNYFVPKIRQTLFPTFELRGEKLKEFQKLSLEDQSKIISKYQMVCFEYYLENNIQGKMDEEEGIFFDIEKIELICFNTGVCFIVLKTQIDGTNNFNDVLDFNYRFKTLSSEFAGLKDFEKIKLQTSTFKDVKNINTFIKNITGVNIKSISKEAQLLGDSQFYIFSYVCIESDKWNEKNKFNGIQNDFLKYSNVLPSTFLSDFDKEALEQNMHIVEFMKYYKTAITKTNCNLICSGIDTANYTTLPFKYENQYFYTYIIALYKSIILKKINNDFKTYEKATKIRHDFIEFTQNFLEAEITQEDEGSKLFQAINDTFEIDNLYKETKMKYEILYKDLNIDKNNHLYTILIELLIFSLCINTVDLIFLMYLLR